MESHLPVPRDSQGNSLNTKYHFPDRYDDAAVYIRSGTKYLPLGTGRG